MTEKQETEAQSKERSWQLGKQEGTQTATHQNQSPMRSRVSKQGAQGRESDVPGSQEVPLQMTPMILKDWAQKLSLRDSPRPRCLQARIHGGQRP